MLRRDEVDRNEDRGFPSGHPSGYRPRSSLPGFEMVTPAVSDMHRFQNDVVREQ